QGAGLERGDPRLAGRPDQVVRRHLLRRVPDAPDHRLHRVPEAAGPRVRPDRADGWNGAHRRAERVGVDPRGRAPGAQVPDANLRAVGRTAERAADDVGPGLVLLRTGRRTSELAARWAGAPASLPGHRPSGAAAL